MDTGVGEKLSVHRLRIASLLSVPLAEAEAEAEGLKEQSSGMPATALSRKQTCALELREFV